MGIHALVLIVAATAAGGQPTQGVLRDEVDLIEINHLYDEQGRHVFDQIIFYDWSPAQARYGVRDWRLLKNPAQVPQRNWRSGAYETIWQDGEIIRRVRSRYLRETWTQKDPELVDRAFLPKENRLGLRKPNPIVPAVAPAGTANVQATRTTTRR